MIAITVSTKYDDILDKIIPLNYTFFYKWFIITDKNDQKTIDVINKYNTKNIEIVFFDFYANDKKFNKGGAIKYVQQMISNTNYRGMVLLIDSDIVLPRNFPFYINKLNLKRNTIYAPIKRLDYYSFKNFINKQPDYIYPHLFVGFFQLYLYDKHFLYEDSYNCSNCDIIFLNYFNNKILIPDLIVGHLGKDTVNWNGRNDKEDFTIMNY